MKFRYISKLYDKTEEGLPYLLRYDNFANYALVLGGYNVFLKIFTDWSNGKITFHFSNIDREIFARNLTMIADQVGNLNNRLLALLLNISTTNRFSRGTLEFIKEELIKLGADEREAEITSEMLKTDQSSFFRRVLKNSA